MLEHTPPPPPPPPPPPNMAPKLPQVASFKNLIKSETYGCQSKTPSTTPTSKSQLLIDIEKGVTLKQRPETNKQSAGINNQNILSVNNSSEDTNPVNLLQAELCSKLKLRQNDQYKKPNFVIPKNSTINAIKKQRRAKSNFSVEPTLKNYHSEDSTSERSPQPIASKTVQKALQSNITPTNTRFLPVLSSASLLSPREIGFKEQDTLPLKSPTTILKTDENLLVSELSIPTSSSITFSACGEENEIINTIQSLKSVDMHEVSRHTELSPAPTRIKLVANKTDGSQSQPLVMATASPLTPRKALPFKMQIPPQSPHKPLVSFWKDLYATNPYPDKVKGQVKVLRSISPSSAAMSVSTSVSSTNETTEFSELKFIITEDGEVIQSSVTQPYHSD